MKKIILCVMAIALLSFATGCEQNKTRVAEGAVIGGLVGGAAGGIIGHQGGNAGAGAGIGIAAGALVGALVGSQINKPNQTADTVTAGQGATVNQMSLQQIADLAKQGVHEDVIIDKIRLSNSKFILTPQDIDYLKQNKVSQKVVDVMQQG